MITEDYVSFEIAKLLKEKGFNIPICSFIRIDWWPDRNIHYVDYVDNWNNQPKIFVSVPTHQMAMKWLREVYNIYITILLLEKEEGDYGYTIEDINDRKYLETSKNNSYNTHKEACEAAILYCLEHLI